MLHIAVRDMHSVNATTRALTSCMKLFAGLKVPLAKWEEFTAFAVLNFQFLQVARFFCNLRFRKRTMSKECFGVRRTRTQP